MKEYWSKADAFLLPLTGLPRTNVFGMRSYLFWNEYNIHDYKLIISYDCEDYESLIIYLRREVFPILDKKGYLLENYDIQGRSIFVLDMSEWAMDIQMFLAGKYSKFSKEAKTLVEDFHTFNENEIPVHIYAVIYPTLEMTLLNDKNAIDYIVEMYKLDINEIKKIGEIGTIYDVFSETLITNIEELCHDDTI